MLVAMALMTGYTDDLRRKLASGNAAVLAIPIGQVPLNEVHQLADDAASQSAARLARVEALPGVARVSPVVLGQGSLSRGAATGARGAFDPDAGVDVTLRGVRPGLSSGAGPDASNPFAARAEHLQPDADGIYGAVLGAELAHRLGVEPGDPLRLVAVGFDNGRPRFRYRSLRYTDTFSTGFAEFDNSWLLLDLDLAGDLIGNQLGSTMYEIAPVDLDDANDIAEQVEAILGPNYLVSNWLDLNRGLFQALELQKLWLFLVLGLIVFVSTFNVASTLLVAVRERMRDLGVLSALGLSPQRLRRVFLIYGSLLGGLGIALGLAAGLLITWVFNTFELIRFDAEVAAIYFIDAVRFQVRVGDVAAIVAFALAVNLLACLLPARRAARLDPASALRYE